jgi:hypothetical protein
MISTKFSNRPDLSSITTIEIDYAQSNRFDFPSLAASVPKGNSLRIEVINPNKEKIDLSFLRFFKDIQSLSLNCYDADLASVMDLIEGIEYLTYKVKKKYDLHFLTRLKSLKFLDILYIKDKSILGKIPSLESLFLSNGSTLGADFRNLSNVKNVDTGMRITHGEGGSELSPLHSMVSFNAHFNLSLSTLDFLEDKANLETADLLWVPKITHFPDMSGCAKLKSITINTCRRLRGFEGLSRAPNLKYVDIDCIADVEDVRPLTKLKNLEKIFVGAAREKSKNQLLDMFGDRFNVDRKEHFIHQLEGL